MHPEDEKHGSFLHRDIRVHEDGWSIELNREYADSLSSTMGVVGQKRPSTIPGSKENAKGKSEEPLGASAHTHYRAGGGISQYMVDGRPDIAFSTKEILRKVSSPVEGDVDKLKKLASYVEGIPRCVQWFPFGASFPEDIDTYVDSDWSGEQDTRKSTNGGAATLRGIAIKNWCTSHSTPSLSSGESELKAIVKGVVESLYIVHLISHQGRELNLKIHTDSTAAMGHANRLGNGKKMRHLEGALLWLQHLVRSGRISLHKVDGIVNPADLYTKYLTFDRICYLMQMLGYHLYDKEDRPAWQSNKKETKKIHWEHKAKEEFENGFSEHDEDIDYVAALWNFIGYISP